jgi:hypothetical protein
MTARWLTGSGTRRPACSPTCLRDALRGATSEFLTSAAAPAWWVLNSCVTVTRVCQRLRPAFCDRRYRGHSHRGICVLPLVRRNRWSALRVPQTCLERSASRRSRRGRHRRAPDRSLQTKTRGWRGTEQPSRFPPGYPGGRARRGIAHGLRRSTLWRCR